MRGAAACRRLRSRIALLTAPAQTDILDAMPAPTAASASSRARRKKAPSRSIRRRRSPTWAPQIAAFEKKYGIKVRLWRGSSEDIARRVINEQRAGRFDADIVETAGPDMEAMVREQALQTFHTPVSASCIPAATLPTANGSRRASTLFAAGYNTKLISAADAPKRYEDLLDPHWKGKLAVEASDANWFMQLVRRHGRGARR